MSIPESGALTEAADDERRPRRRGRALIVVAALVLIAALAAFLVTRDDSEGDESVPAEEPARTTLTVDDTGGTAVALADFEGSSDDQTDVFEVSLNWQLKWQLHGGSRFQVELFTEDGTSRGILLTEADEAEGSTFVSEAGVFFLKVTSDGEWSIDIVGPPPS